MLQQQLEKIRNNNYILDNTLNIDSLSSNMLEHIKSYEFLYGNIKSFLRSLFFRLRKLSICEETECEVEKLLQELPKYY
ncbi:hypothetical protein [Bacillus sp. SN10]|uniref:hypothetical protein n=1 Tax=Bacillus sp. SN10 TaxID=2056493 RepID=UPI000C31D7ED|nr:hypothetical protein [Bacillus sp. SN10]PKJ57323.1 hypothetical protein CWE34_04375 [Bacillus sp. SN10]